MIDYKLDSIAFDIENAEWKCSKCGSINSSKGNMNIANIVSEGDTFKAFIKEDPDNPLIDAPWKYVVEKLLNNPEKCFRWIKNYLNLDNCKCSKCSNSEAWAKINVFSRLLSLSIILFLGGMAIAILTKEIAGIAASVIGLVLLAGYYLSRHNERKAINTLDKESYPKIIFTDEVIEALSKEKIEQK